MIDGDLFKADKSFSLAHCISLDYEMGAGIAVKFRNNYANKETDIKDLKAQSNNFSLFKASSLSIYKRNELNFHFIF